MKIPVIAPTPFKKLKTPPHLHSILLNHCKLPFKPIQWDQYCRYTEHEGVSNPPVTQNVKDNGLPISINWLAYRVLTPLIEDWSLTKVNPTHGHGVREYGPGSTLCWHRDRPETHILSCIIHIDDKSNTPWPLDFVDHNGKHNEIIFKPGEMLFYESLCPHARQQPFDGEYYRNTYYHWRPCLWNPNIVDGLKYRYSSLDEVKKDY
jgi:prolyl 4-hydroxylase